MIQGSNIESFRRKFGRKNVNQSLIQESNIQSLIQESNIECFRRTLELEFIQSTFVDGSWGLSNPHLWMGVGRIIKSTFVDGSCGLSNPHLWMAVREATK